MSGPVRLGLPGTLKSQIPDWEWRIRNLQSVICNFDVVSILPRPNSFVAFVFRVSVVNFLYALPVAGRAG